MFTFLPAMKGATASLLIQALEEMKQHYNHSEFGRHISRFKTILHRSNTIATQEKRIVEEYMDYHYASLLDEDPEIKEKVARGKVEALQEMAVEAVKSKYPPLVQLAEERVIMIKQPESLRQMVILIFNSPDESTARWVLNTFAA